MSELYTIEKEDDVTILAIDIEGFHHDYNEEIKEAFAKLVEEKVTKVILDFSNVTYVSSVILASMVYVQKNIQDIKGTLLFCGIDERVMEIIKMTNLDKLFEISATREEALNKIK